MDPVSVSVRFVCEACSSHKSTIKSISGFCGNMSTQVCKAPERPYTSEDACLAASADQEHVCYRCSSPLKEGHGDLDRIVPKSAGGSDGNASLQVRCSSCRQLESYLEWLSIVEDGRSLMSICPIGIWELVRFSREAASAGLWHPRTS